MNNKNQRLTKIAFCAALALLAACAPNTQESAAPAAGATAALDPKDFSGTWDRYPQATDTQRDPTTVTLPAPDPDSAAAAEA